MIATKCQNTGGLAGILGSLENERGDILFVTNTEWKCSSVFEDGWEQPEFQDTSSNWQNAQKVSDHDSTFLWKSLIGKISLNADWIWSQTQTMIVYCRGKILFKGK